MVVFKRYSVRKVSTLQSLQKQLSWSIKRLILIILLGYPIWNSCNHFVVRQSSISLGNGTCLWTESVALSLNSDPYGTLLASYPASGMRITWQQIAGLTGITVGDDFQYSGQKSGIIKTQYPHYEGIWSYGSSMDQVIILIRNPRWAIPSFHNILSEINYAQSWDDVYKYIRQVFTARAPMANWIKWRDLKFDEEINLWAWHIDYYMERGAKYWLDLDFERVGQKPFRFHIEKPKPWGRDLHCVYDLDCFPKAVISYEKLLKNATGPLELRKMAEALRGKKEMTVIEDQAIDCVWSETFIHAQAPNNFDRDAGGLPADAYNFTNAQMESILDKLNFMRNKYSQGKWTNISVAMDIVSALDDYIVDVGEEYAGMVINPSPTPAPNLDYHQNLLDWYDSMGRGDRYAYDKVRQMHGYWPKVMHLYNVTEEQEDNSLLSNLFSSPSRTIENITNIRGTNVTNLRTSAAMGYST